MVMDIIKPDTGEVLIFGERINEPMKNRLGYLPEERGLYKTNTVINSLEYFGALKGMTRAAVQSRAEELLGRVDMKAHKNKKFQELSRGMSQIIQFLITIIHEPSLMILDEPFANLDPINVELLKTLSWDAQPGKSTSSASPHERN
jgi:ABC-2 type transport system ATP-binding protein